MEHIVLTIFYFFKSFGLIGIFLSMFIENIGIPLPTELGYILGQEMINMHRYSLEIVLLILTIGHLSGALIAYRIGRWGDSMVAKKLKENRKIVEVNEKLKKWYKKYGSITVFLTRFVGYVRPWSSFVAGFAEVPLFPFILWTTLGSLLFNIVVLYMSGILILIWRKFEFLHFIITFSMFCLFFALIIFELIKVLSKRKKSNGSKAG